MGRRGESDPARLLAETEPPDQIGVPIGILALEVVKEAPTLPDKLQEPAARVVIFGVDLEMFGQVADALTEYRNLHFR